MKMTFSLSLCDQDNVTTIKRLPCLPDPTFWHSFFLYKYNYYKTVTIIASGHKSIDTLLGGGFRSGFITDIFGDSKLATNTISLLASIAAARSFCDSVVIYIDIRGNFRPELVLEHLRDSADSNIILNKIIVVRLDSDILLKSTIRKALVHRPKMIVIDNFVTLFTNEFNGITRHLSVMHNLRYLAVTALNHDLAIIITNPSVYQKTDYYRNKRANLKSISGGPYIISKKEVLGSTLGIYTDTVLQIERSQIEKSIYYARLVKPHKHGSYRMRIISGRIEEMEGED
jgi:RecA/RadA recombinase